jgi:hypothetical protein
MAETFEAYRTRVLSYLGDEEPIGVQQATPSQLDRRLRDVALEDLIRRPAPEKWSIAEIVAHLADAELVMGWRLRNMLANPGVAFVVESGRMGGAPGLRAARCERFGRGVSGAAREQPATVGVGPARTVGGVLWGPRVTRTANGRGVRPLGSGTRLEPSSADRPHLGWAYDRAVMMAWECRRTSCCSRCWATPRNQFHTAFSRVPANS